MPRTPRRVVVFAAAALAAASVGTAVAAAAPVTPRTAAGEAAAAAAPARSVVRLSVPAALRSAPFDVARKLTVPTGWTAAVWARVPGVRFAAWAPDGALLVSQPGNGRVQRLVPGRTPAAVPTSTTLLSGLDGPHSLVFAGSSLYVGENSRVTRWTYSGGTATNPVVMISGLPTGGHGVKGIAVAGGALYVSVGSSSNATPGERDANPPRAVIWRVTAPGAAPQLWSKGVRNSTGMSVAPDGSVWGAINNRDNIGYPWHRDYDGDGSDDYGKVLQAYVNDHPAEEIAKLTSGRDLGWPLCNPDPDVTPGSPTTAFRYVRPPFVADVQNNPGGSALDCSTLAPVEQTLPAHSAPLGFHFVTGSTLPAAWRNGAVVATHGSWNRTPARPPSVWFVNWTGSTLSGTTPMITGFQAADGSRWGRPADAVPGPDGALYVTDDASGTVYRFAPSA